MALVRGQRTSAAYQEPGHRPHNPASRIELTFLPRELYPREKGTASSHKGSSASPPRVFEKASKDPPRIPQGPPRIVLTPEFRPNAMPPLPKRILHAIRPQRKIWSGEYYRRRETKRRSGENIRLGAASITREVAQKGDLSKTQEHVRFGTANINRDVQQKGSQAKP